MNRDTLRVAFGNGKVVILATHGDHGYAKTYFASEVLSVGPPDTGATDERKSFHFLKARVLGKDNKWSNAENVPVNDQLQLAYIFACDGGNKEAQWREHLAPAHVVSYNRVSTVLDHALWFAFTGPAQLREVR